MMHNPDNLTEWGQADGWRLLDEDEIPDCGVAPMECSFWSRYAEDWDSTGCVFLKLYTIRTKLTREELAAKRGIKTGRCALCKGEVHTVGDCPTAWSKEKLVEELTLLKSENARLRTALERLRDCDWVITPLNRMDAVREIAREALMKEKP